MRRTMAEPDPKLLEILVCPATKAPLIYDREKKELVSKAAGLAYPIRNGVPIMLASARHAGVQLVERRPS